MSLLGLLLPLAVNAGTGLVKKWANRGEVPKVQDAKADLTAAGLSLLTAAVGQWTGVGVGDVATASIGDLIQGGLLVAGYNKAASHYLYQAYSAWRSK